MRAGSATHCYPLAPPSAFGMLSDTLTIKIDHTRTGIKEWILMGIHSTAPATMGVAGAGLSMHRGLISWPE